MLVRELDTGVIRYFTAGNTLFLSRNNTLHRCENAFKTRKGVTI